LPLSALAGEVELEGISAAGTDHDVDKVPCAFCGLTPSRQNIGTAGWRGNTIYRLNQALTFPPQVALIVNGERKPVKGVDSPAEECPSTAASPPALPDRV
jgi:hypothetical protein